MYKLLFLCCISLLASWAHGKDASVFEIELLVLERSDIKTNERLQHQIYAPRPDFGSGRAFFLGDNWPQQATWSKEIISQSALRPSTHRILAQSQLRLTKYLEEFNQDDVQRFKPLLHVGWHQHVQSRNKAKPWFFSTNHSDNSMQLDGLFSVYIFNRYLFIDSNLQFRLPSHQLNSSQPFFSTLSNEPMAYIQTPLQDKRRVLSDKVQGFDHPLGLMLVEIRKL